MVSGSRVRAEPGEIFYRHAGPADAPSMVHLHGFGISGTYLLPTAALLVDDYRTYVPDLPGYGRTPGPRKPLSIAALADSVVAFMDSVGLERTTVVANSMGCMVTLRCIERHPDRAERAILVSPAGSLHNRPLGRGLSQLMRDGLHEPNRLLKVAGPDYARFGVVNSLRLFSEMTKSPTIKNVFAMRTPILAVVGHSDPLLPAYQKVVDLSEAADDRPHLGVVYLHDAAHAINFSHPAELAQVIRAYLADPTLSDPAALPPAAEVLAHAEY